MKAKISETCSLRQIAEHLFVGEWFLQSSFKLWALSLLHLNRLLWNSFVIFFLIFSEWLYFRQKIDFLSWVNRFGTGPILFILTFVKSTFIFALALHLTVNSSQVIFWLYTLWGIIINSVIPSRFAERFFIVRVGLEWSSDYFNMILLRSSFLRRLRNFNIRCFKAFLQ